MLEGQSDLVVPIVMRAWRPPQLAGQLSEGLETGARQTATLPGKAQRVEQPPYVGMDTWTCPHCGRSRLACVGRNSQKLLNTIRR